MKSWWANPKAPKEIGTPPGRALNQHIGHTNKPTDTSTQKEVENATAYTREIMQHHSQKATFESATRVFV
eukprot:6136158-Pleurochrysis_carterae.AAC.1